MAATGKVVYWESISSAATFAFIKKDKSGVEHVLSGLSSGERVVGITNAESAGFVLTFNSGRLAYLNVRDSHGRPAVSVQFLRSGLSTQAGGFFGSIRNAFSNLSLRGEVAAVRADRSTRVGERNVVALSTRGRLQAWRIHRGGHNECVGEADIREKIVEALNDMDPVSAQFSPDSFEAFDFAYAPKGLEFKYQELTRLSEAISSDNALIQHLVLLVGLTQRSKARYALVEVILSPNKCQVGMVRPITSYSTPAYSSDDSQAGRPRLYLPRPALVAFIVFERAAVLASIAVPPESPDSQLQSDNHSVPSSYEDVVDFGEGENQIIGSGSEETTGTSSSEELKPGRYKAKNPSAILMVRGAGVIRFVTTDIDKFASEKPPSVSAKNKLEQAVFFGTRQHNPISFDGQQEIKFSNEELSQAALDISAEILSSSAAHMSTLPAAMEDNLKERSQYLRRLMAHLNTLDAKLSRATRWQLLWNAEKMHVATDLWRMHEQLTQSRGAENKKSLLGSIVEFIHEGEKHNPVPKIGEVDKVRHWFVNDIIRLDLFVAWAYEVIKTLYKERLLNDAQITIMMYEAVKINISAHVGAIEFRKDNLHFYGIKDGLELGILGDYSGLEEPWTGSYFIANNLRRLWELSEQWTKRMKEELKGATDQQLLQSITSNLPALADVMLTSVSEQSRWALQVPEKRRLGQDFAEAYESDRYNKIITLAHIGFWEEGSKLARKHSSINALAVILLDHVDDLEAAIAHPGVSPVDVGAMAATRQAKKTEITQNFSDLGVDFAFPLYEHLLKQRGIQAVLGFELDTLGFKTKFLRSRPELAKISWMNDIEAENDVHHAATTLIDLAMNKEQQVWNQKIELSMGKLALLADQEEHAINKNLFRTNVEEARIEKAIGDIDKQLYAVAVQDRLFQIVHGVTFAAIDETAAINIAMETFSKNIPKRHKVVSQLLENSLKCLMKRDALDAMTLIDLLTLIHLDEDASDELGDPFALALTVVANCCYPDESKEAVRLIWRRLLIRDDWATVNDTQFQSDEEVNDKILSTQLANMLYACVCSSKLPPIRRPISHTDIDSDDTPEEPFKAINPRSAIGAFTENLDRRFRDFGDDFRLSLRDAHKYEDKLLKQHIDKHKLTDWVSSALDVARAQRKQDLDRATFNGDWADLEAQAMA